jgi:hypothetical protein
MTIAQQRIFLTAEWKNLLMLNYVVDPAILESLVPQGTSLDQFDGKTYVSLIGFEFNNTRILGRAIPFHQSFEEVNLRFYVRREARRGVVFIRELVPKFAVAAIARLAYGERYSSVPMSHRIERGEGITAEFSWGSGAGMCTIAAQTSGDAYLPKEGSLPQFITEHYWGYAAQPDGRTAEYQVEHPQWTVLDAPTAEFSGDGEKYYGPEFAKVLGEAPDCVFLAEGSAVTIFKSMVIS